ncbi:putative choline-phosphate cytidylyltransferase [Leucoagaricus sp. SymC.cos]|nr:putative choline-phosphate cytidylyltransferase [Leucoagaricus sp. SymC.cos]
MKHHLAASVLSDSDGVDSPTYDGDVESSTAGNHTDTPANARVPTLTRHYTSSTSTLSNPHTTDPVAGPDNITPGLDEHQTDPLSVAGEPPIPALVESTINPAALTPDDIQKFVRKAIEGESFRNYQINPPPTDRPVRVYADGVYDLFHFGHALQLRQAKLSFPSVHLIVGISSDEQCAELKFSTVMNHAERIEMVRHCRWVDEVFSDIPWTVDEDFLNKHQIDYVAHDEVPYLSAGHDDVYALVKRLGKFLPTRRTPGVSTSELLERVVSKYRQRDFDDKLVQMGHAELRAEGSDYDDLSPNSRRASLLNSPIPGSGGLNDTVPPSSTHATLGSSRVVSPLVSPGASQSASRSQSPPTDT